MVALCCGVLRQGCLCFWSTAHATSHSLCIALAELWLRHLRCLEPVLIEPHSSSESSPTGSNDYSVVCMVYDRICSSLTGEASECRAGSFGIAPAGVRQLC